MSNLFDELTTALAKEDFETALLAVELGADLNGTDGFYMGTVLYWAVTAGEPTDEAALRRVRWLLEHGARVECASPIHGSTSVHAAAEEGYSLTLKMLLDAGGKETLALFDDASRTPLICAVSKGHIEVARVLIEEGADVNARDEARSGNSALSYAVEEKNEEMVSFLLSRGADPMLPGWMQLSAFDRAAPWRASRHPELQRIYQLLQRAVTQT